MLARYHCRLFTGFCIARHIITTCTHGMSQFFVSVVDITQLLRYQVSRSVSYSHKEQAYKGCRRTSLAVDHIWNKSRFWNSLQIYLQPFQNKTKQAAACTQHLHKCFVHAAAHQLEIAKLQSLLSQPRCRSLNQSKKIITLGGRGWGNEILSSMTSILVDSHIKDGGCCVINSSSFCKRMQLTLTASV